MIKQAANKTKNHCSIFSLTGWWWWGNHVQIVRWASVDAHEISFVLIPFVFFVDTFGVCNDITNSKVSLLSFYTCYMSMSISYLSLTLIDFDCVATAIVKINHKLELITCNFRAKYQHQNGTLRCVIFRTTILSW